MIRFVLSPEGVVTPDVRRRLPGRGVWVDATHASVALAVRRRAFSRAFKAQAEAPADLADHVEALLCRCALERLRMAHKAGILTMGFEKVRAALQGSKVAVLVIASDAAPDGRQKVEALANKVANLHNRANVVDGFSSSELESTLGRERVVHLALSPHRLSELFLMDAARLRAYRLGAAHPAADGDHQPDEHTFAGPLSV